MELTDFSVFYSQDSIANAEAALKNKGSRIVVEKGQIVKVSKDENGIVTREVLTKNWTDWIDYWAVDFDFESKREIIRVKNEETGDWEERWTGDYIFENEWQSFPHQERPVAGTEKRLSRMHVRAAQDRGQGGGHLRQRHDDDRGSQGGVEGRKEIMALHKDFPQSPHAILDPAIRWFPADEALRETSMEKLMPPLVAVLRRKVKEWRDSGYVGAADTSRSLLNWWFKTPHLLPKADGDHGGVSVLLRPTRGAGDDHLPVRCGGGEGQVRPDALR